MRGSRTHVAAFVAIVAGTGCSRTDRSGAWIEASAAVVQCTTAGRTRMPPVLLGLPFPRPPTGLYARAMDPMALNDMGYQRDRPVCAALLVPDDELVLASAVRLPTLAAVAQRTSEAALHSVTCPCATADALGVRDLVVGCATRPARVCEATDARREELSALLLPLVQAIESTPIPRVHWRLVGPTDRATWFAERLDALLGRHGGGSTIFLPGQAVPSRDNHALIRTLLDLPDVVAVVRQDNGRGLLVARVTDGMQILDHFALPSVSAKLAPLRDYWDNTRPDDIIDALAKPAQGYPVGLPTKAGNLAELDVEALERVDAMLVAASSLSGSTYDKTQHTREQPEVLVDRITVQAPFGTEGQALRVRVALSDAGRQWATLLPDTRLSVDVDPLNLASERPRFIPPDGQDLPFVLRATEAERVLVHGLHRVGEVMHAMEVFAPGSVQGTARSWDFALPQGALAHGGAMVARPSLKSLAEQVLERQYRVTATVDDAAGTIVAEIAPD